MTVPLNPGKPIILGVPQVGQTLVSTVGAWLNGPTSYSFIWLRNMNIVIQGAINQTYVTGSADVGFVLQCEVVAHNSDGASLPITSFPTAAVTAATGVGTLNFSDPNNSGLIAAISF